MSCRYSDSKAIPTKVLTTRLNQLSNAVTEGRKGIEREFYMRVPAELDHDADLVIAEASRRITELEKELHEQAGLSYLDELSALKDKLRDAIEKMEKERDRCFKTVEDVEDGDIWREAIEILEVL